MTIDRLRDVHQARPFKPFIMYMADGAKVKVTHPESLAYNPTGRTAVFVDPKDHHHYIDLLLVARLEVTNGARRRTQG